MTAATGLTAAQAARLASSVVTEDAVAMRPRVVPVLPAMVGGAAMPAHTDAAVTVAQVPMAGAVVTAAPVVTSRVMVATVVVVATRWCLAALAVRAATAAG